MNSQGQYCHCVWNKMDTFLMGVLLCKRASIPLYSKNFNFCYCYDLSCFFYGASELPEVEIFKKRFNLSSKLGKPLV